MIIKRNQRGKNKAIYIYHTKVLGGYKYKTYNREIEINIKTDVKPGVDYCPYGLCELFYSEPFPEFYPPQLPQGKTICIRKDIKIKKVDDIIIYGQIKECYGEEPIEGAIIKYFIINPFTEKLEDICHTFSGCSGYYMILIPPIIKIFNPNIKEYIDFSLEGETIIVMVSGSDCPNNLEPCECNE